MFHYNIFIFQKIQKDDETYFQIQDFFHKFNLDISVYLNTTDSFDILNDLNSVLQIELFAITLIRLAPKKIHDLNKKLAVVIEFYEELLGANLQRDYRY